MSQVASLTFSSILELLEEPSSINSLKFWGFTVTETWQHWKTRCRAAGHFARNTVVEQVEKPQIQTYKYPLECFIMFKIFQNTSFY